MFSTVLCFLHLSIWTPIDRRIFNINDYFYVYTDCIYSVLRNTYAMKGQYFKIFWYYYFYVHINSNVSFDYVMFHILPY